MRKRPGKSLEKSVPAYIAVAFLIALVILHFYKLNDHDVQLMTKVNSGQMTRKEAEAQMKNTY